MKIAKLEKKMIEYNCGDEKRINHALKVHELARIIGTLEELPQKEQFNLECSAILHDIGIKVCEEKYNNCNGKLQEKEGPAVAEAILKEVGIKDMDRILYLIAHHHTYTDINGADYQILIEADLIVNLTEENYSQDNIKRVFHKQFKTKTSREIFKSVFNF